MEPDRAAAPVSPRRRAVLEVLREADGPLGVGDIAERIGVHANTVRFHLDALVTSGAVEGLTEPSSGRGRPRTVYAPRRGMDRGGQREYLLLARILLSRLASDEADAETAAVEAGRAWGGHLLPPVPPFRTVEAAEAVERLTGLLADLGFDPEPVHGPPDRPADQTATAAADAGPRIDAGADGADDDGAAEEADAGRILLRHCPFLELAEEYGEIVCPLHLGLMQGALEQQRAPVAAVRLEPFAEPDVCVAHLAPVP
ncbi:helix-turn-helix transcriptional regulator [Streptomyces sp. NPDC101219]|uniref:helix-turn-helix transcriptional regulator n=1 Tax=Streptomyces sp. NPDC101219 TaxID=3366131 RepID=UPI003820EFF0